MLATKSNSYTFQKDGVWYFSRRVPADLRRHYQTGRIAYSLRTKSIRDARVKAVSAMVEKAEAKLGSVDYLQGPFDVIADAEVDSYETASGLQAIMMASGGWDELLLLPTMDIDKALNVARTVGGYPMPDSE